VNSGDRVRNGNKSRSSERLFEAQNEQPISSMQEVKQRHWTEQKTCTPPCWRLYT